MNKWIFTKLLGFCMRLTKDPFGYTIWNTLSMMQMRKYLPSLDQQERTLAIGNRCNTGLGMISKQASPGLFHGEKTNSVVTGDLAEHEQPKLVIGHGIIRYTWRFLRTRSVITGDSGGQNHCKYGFSFLRRTRSVITGDLGGQNHCMYGFSFLRWV